MSGSLNIVGYAVIDPDGDDLISQFDTALEAEAYAEANGCKAPIPVVDFGIQAIEGLADVIPFPELEKARG